jgi:hypothetical protein
VASGQIADFDGILHEEPLPYKINWQENRDYSVEGSS